MIDKLILAPYYWALRLRHLLYDSGAKKSSPSPVPSICIGNIAAGGTGKTPHTEMLIRLIRETPRWKGKNIAVLSRGYRRKSKGFRIVEAGGSARTYGDEPMQIKNKFPEITVAVDRDRVEGCRILAEGAKNGRGGKLPAADVIILDDAFQYRALRPDFSIVLVDYRKPAFRDHLIPLGRLRDIPERLSAADLVIASKCPSYIDPWERSKWTESLGFKGNVLFTTICYDELKPVFPEGDPHYIHSPRLILFTGIANDTPLVKHMGDNYQIVSRFRFGDHHGFSQRDISRIDKAARQYPTALIVTTEKDAQRLADCSNISRRLKERIFKIPVRAHFVSEEDERLFASAIGKAIGAKTAK